MSEIMVGDIVTWGKKVEPTKDGTIPLRIKGCKVVELGESEDGQPAAMVEVFGQRAGVLLSDLEKE